MDLYIDFKSPASYLAVKPSLALAEKLGVRIAWHPYRTVQRAPLQKAPDETKTQTHFRIRDDYRRGVWRLYADVQGVPLQFRDTPGQTDLALATLLSLGPYCQNFVEAAFAAYWRDGADLNSDETLTGIAEELGVTYRPASNNELEEALHSAADAGVIDAPTYIVGGQVFIGREHLPWIEELLSGATASA